MHLDFVPERVSVEKALAERSAKTWSWGLSSANYDMSLDFQICTISVCDIADRNRIFDYALTNFIYALISSLAAKGD